MAKQKIMPFFLPMRGCPKHCIYCDQGAISGAEHVITPSEVAETLRNMNADPEVQVAFYGGSFTCLPRKLQLRYLAAVAPACHDGTVAPGVRISTRPDAIDENTCSFLLRNGVSTVELGAQSFDNHVLSAIHRGYTSQDLHAACWHIKNAGLTLGIQLMTGLPEDTEQKSLCSVREAVCCGADLLRIYPTLVLKNTSLATMYNAGLYQPQTLSQAVSCCASMLELATAAGLTVQRIGLQPGESLEESLVAGPYHPAFGGLVHEELRQRQLQKLLTDYDPKQPALLRFARNELPLLFGQNNSRLAQLANAYPALALKPEKDITSGELRLFIEGNERVLGEAEYCRSRVADFMELN